MAAIGEIQLGDVARDPITGVEGVVIARTDWLTGCARLGLQRKEQKDGKVPDPWWVDEPAAELVKVGAFRMPRRSTGGPQPDPSR